MLWSARYATAPMNKPFQPAGSRLIRTWLELDPSFQTLARQVEDLVALQRVLRQASGGAPVTVTGLADRVLTIAVPGPAWATRLRQSEPSLIAALARAGFPVDKIRIRPVRRPGPALPVRPPKAPLPALALAALAELQADAASSPLREALGALLARHGGAPGGQAAASRNKTAKPD